MCIRRGLQTWDIPQSAEGKSRESQGRCRGMWGKQGLVVEGRENREGWWEGWRQGEMGLTQAADPFLQPEFPSASRS